MGTSHSKTDIRQHIARSFGTAERKNHSEEASIIRASPGGASQSDINIVTPEPLFNTALIDDIEFLGLTGANGESTGASQSDTNVVTPLPLLNRAIINDTLSLSEAYDESPGSPQPDDEVVIPQPLLTRWLIKNNLGLDESSEEEEESIGYSPPSDQNCYRYVLGKRDGQVDSPAVRQRIAEVMEQWEITRYIVGQSSLFGQSASDSDLPTLTRSQEASRRRRSLSRSVSSDDVYVGLSPGTIDRLPTFIYEVQTNREPETCRICCSSYETGEKLQMLPCFHKFHEECINPWIKKSTKCPLCKSRVSLPQEGFD